MDIDTQQVVGSLAATGVEFKAVWFSTTESTVLCSFFLVLLCLCGAIRRWSIGSHVYNIYIYLCEQSGFYLGACSTPPIRDSTHRMDGP